MRFLLFFLSVTLIQTTCLNRSEQNEVRMGYGVPADLIVVFRPNVSLEDRSRFNEETIGRKLPGRDGVSFLPGIEASLALPNLCSNQHGIALKLRGSVTDVQLQAIRSAITASPIVEGLLENYEPANVKCAKNGKVEVNNQR